jgi:hypothetical protein
MDTSSVLDGFSKEMDDHLRERAVKNSFFYEFAMLFGRNTILIMRNPKNFIYKIFMYIFLALVHAILYVKVRNYLIRD